MELSHTITNARSIDQVVEAINGSAWVGDLTDDQLAGQYAYEAQRQSGYPIDDEALVVHLDVLASAGAKFDFIKAKKYGLELAAHFAE